MNQSTTAEIRGWGAGDWQDGSVCRILQSRGKPNTSQWTFPFEKKNLAGTVCRPPAKKKKPTQNKEIYHDDCTQKTKLSSSQDNSQSVKYTSIFTANYCPPLAKWTPKQKFWNCFHIFLCCWLRQNSNVRLNEQKNRLTLYIPSYQHLQGHYVQSGRIFEVSIAIIKFKGILQSYCRLTQFSLFCFRCNNLWFSSVC